MRLLRKIRRRGWRAFPNPFRHSSLDHAQLVTIGLILAFSVFAFGGTEAWSQVAIGLMTSLLAIFVLLRPLVDRKFTLSTSWAWLPMVMLVFLHLLQVTSVPSDWAAMVSPTRLEAYSAMGAAEVPVPQQMTLSVSQLSTEHSLRFVIMAAFFLLAVTSYLRTREHVEKLLIVVFGVGCAQSVLALAQNFTGADKLYWTVDPGKVAHANSGSFVNYSNFSQFVNLAIGAGVGLLFIRLHRAERRKLDTEGAWRADSWEMLRNETWILGGLAICILAVCLSLSRNGILSLTIAAAAVGSLLSLNQRISWSGWVVSLVPVLVFGLLMLFGFDLFYDRLATLKENDVYQDRWQLTLDSMHVGLDYLLVGSGLGSYPLVFPEYDTTGSAAAAVYADNDYAQLFAEAGIAGLLILVATIMVIARYVVRSLTGHQASAKAAVYGLLAALIAVAIHSVTDFGQRIPAVFFMSIAVIGTLVVLPRIRRSPTAAIPSRTHQELDRRRPWGACLVMASVALLTSFWMVRGALNHYQAETWWAVAQYEQFRLEEKDWVGSQDEYTNLVQAAENAVAWEPANVVTGYWLNQYRWQALLNTPSNAATADEALVIIVPVAEKIAGELSLLRAQCPSFHLPYLFEGELRGVYLNQVEAADSLFSRGADLAKSDPQAQLLYGRWAVAMGHQDIALDQLTRTVQISPNSYPAVAELIIDNLQEAETAKSLAGDDLGRLQVLLRLLEARPEHSALATELSQEIDKRLIGRASRGVASSGELVSLAKKAAENGENQHAIDLYRRALATNFNDFECRLALAKLLHLQGDIDAARRETRICLRLRPKDPSALKLLEQLAVEVEPNNQTSIDFTPGNDGLRTQRTNILVQKIFPDS